MIRYVDFPKMKDDEVRQSLRFEAQKYFPFSTDEVNIDARILIQDLGGNKMLVLLAAVKKEFINQRLKMIQAAGIKTNIVDLDSIALINAFNFNYSKNSNSDSDTLKHKTVAILNIGAASSNLNILEDGIPRLSRDIQIAGNNFTQKLQEILGVDFKTAEELKLKADDKERLDKVISAGEAALSNLSGEIRTSFDYYESQSDSSVGKIFLSGGGSRFRGLKDTLANLLGIEVEYWDPLRKISASSNIDVEKAKELSGQLAVAVGLALRK
jgi:type IV pilus assembly protein PilM